MQCHLFTYFAIEMVTYDMNTINIYERESICTMVDFSEMNSNNSLFKTKYSNFLYSDYFVTISKFIPSLWKSRSERGYFKNRILESLWNDVYSVYI